MALWFSGGIAVFQRGAWPAYPFGVAANYDERYPFGFRKIKGALLTWKAKNVNRLRCPFGFRENQTAKKSTRERLAGSGAPRRIEDENPYPTVRRTCVRPAHPP
jgi:hypothetical protein